MSDRDTAASRRYAGGGGYDWRRGSTGSVAGTASKGDFYNSVKNGQIGTTTTTEGAAGSSYTQTGNISRPEQDRYFNPVALYTDVPSSVAGLNFSSPRPVIQDKAKAIARWDAPPGSPDALPEWLREQVRQMAYAYQGRKVPDSWVRGFWEKTINANAELGTDATVLQSMYTKVLADEQSDRPGGGGYPSGGGGYGGGGGGGSVSLTDPTSARGLLMQTMQGVLGRNPTTREYRDFLDTLNQTEMANPRTVSFEGDVAVQSGGVDPSVLALEFAQGAEDYKATQANKFYNAFMGALAGGISG
jgi:hypothetical protein